jgi:hypothetical protein
MCSLVGGGIGVYVAKEVGNGLSEESPTRLSGADGIKKQSEIATTTKSNPSGKWNPRAFARRENMRRRVMVFLIVLRFTARQDFCRCDPIT